MLDGAIIEVAIGLALIFFVFSIVVSGVYEAVAKVLAWRAKSLWAAIYVMFTDSTTAKATKPGQRLLNASPVGDARPTVGAESSDQSADTRGSRTSDPPHGATSSSGTTRPDPAAARMVTRLYAHPIVGGFEQRARAKKTRIDRIEPSSFARALIDTLVPDAQATITVDEWIKQVDAATWVPVELRKQLAALVREANGDFTKLRANIETWFEAQMNTLSRRYRRRARYFTLAFGLIVAVACNVDAIDAATRLYRDDVARAALVSHADTVAAGCADSTGDELTTCLEGAADSVSRGATLPVGWSNANIRALSPLGWLLAGIAIAQGAPFWFDVLKRAMTHRRSRATASNP